MRAQQPPGHGRTSRWLSIAVPALALMAPATAAAAPVDASAARAPATLRSLGSLPNQVLAGSSFTLSVRIRNTARAAKRPLVTVRLRKQTHAGGGKLVAAERLRKLKPGAVRRFEVEVDLPASLAAGRYYVSVCSGLSVRSASCRTYKGRLRVVKPKPPAPQPSDKRYDVLVLTETRAPGDAHGSTAAAGLEALKEAGKSGDFKVTEAAQSAGAFTEASLESYRTVVFLNTSGDVLSDNEQSAFEHYFRQGGGFVGIHSALVTEPNWAFMTSLLGTRAVTGSSTIRTESAQEAATIKVADRVHDASKSLAERFDVTDSFYNTTSEVRGFQHVLATVDEDTYVEEDGDVVTTGTTDDHPIMWCQDFEGGRSFYTGVGHNPATFANADVRRNLAGAITWAAGKSDPVYSDCGATVLANYKQVKISAPPNLNEPIGFDQLPDGRIIQTARAGQVRLHDPEGGTTTVLADLSKPPFPQGLYTHSEDGLYGPAVDANFAQNKWVYLYYSPAVVKDVRQSDGTTRTIRTPTGQAGELPIAAPVAAASVAAWDPYVGYFQLSRFKFVDAAPGNPAHLDPASEQEIMRVPVNRGACCHVGGDIDFDKAGNLWLVTGDDTPSGGGNSGGFSPHNDSVANTDEFQTVRVNNADGGSFTLTFDGQTTGAIPYNATANLIDDALTALSNVEPEDVVLHCGTNPCSQAQTVSNTTMTVVFDGQYAQENVPEMTAVLSLTSSTGATPSVAFATTQQAGLIYAPYVDARRSAMNTNDLRGKVLRIKVNDNGTYTVPSGNLFTAGTTGARPEIYAMGFRNPFRIQVDSKGIAYITDYSPDSQIPQTFRGPQGTGRVEVVRKPSNYAWPLCVTPTVPYYQWNFNTATPLDPANPRAYECNNPAKGPDNTSRWNTGQTVDATVAPGRVQTPPLTQPDIWYSYRDNQNPPQGTPCLDAYDGVGADGSVCPQLFPELFTGGVGPHGATTYEFDPGNPSETKFPPYYDGATILGEFTQDTMREIRFDSSNKVLEINPFLNCGQAVIVTTFPFECDNPMDLQFGADGNFYLLTYGDGFFTPNADAGMYRWEYTKGPQRPRAVIGATPTNGVAPLTVQFSSAGSRDEDPGDSITFAWDFDNNGTVDSTAPSPSFVYTANGVYTARLTVTDSTGKSDSASTVITVGNTAPTLTINTPLNGDFFTFGQTIPFTVTGSDAQDGAIDSPAECARVTVTFVLIHDTHGHAEDSTPATWDPAASVCRGVLGTDAGDASHGGYLAGGINASFTDNPQGSIPALETTTQHVVQLRRQELEDAQEMAGLTTTAAEGGRAVSSIDPGDWVALNNRFDLTNMNKEITIRYGAGAAGVAAGTPRLAVEVRQGAVDGPLLTSITLGATGAANNNTYASRTAPLTFTGSQRLFLVFRSVTGGPTTGLGNLNWVEFSGSGAGVNP
jgi:PKD repeat protein/type 1 glutamine amidotransferase